jgi:ribosome-associated toxin RatA of RatAB toxin-antitoxin module
VTAGLENWRDRLQSTSSDTTNEIFMKGIKFTKSITINCSQAEAFDYTQDYTNRLKWDTFLKKAELIEGAAEAEKGVKAYCVAKNGLGMITEYVSFNRPKATAIKMTKGPFLFKSFLGSWTFKALTATETEVIFLYSFTLRFPFNLFTPFIKNNLQANVQQRLVDLKNNLEKKYK